MNPTDGQTVDRRVLVAHRHTGGLLTVTEALAATMRATDWFIVCRESPEMAALPSKAPRPSKPARTGRKGPKRAARVRRESPFIQKMRKLERLDRSYASMVELMINHRLGLRRDDASDDEDDAAYV